MLRNTAYTATKHVELAPAQIAVALLQHIYSPFSCINVPDLPEKEKAQRQLPL